MPPLETPILCWAMVMCYFFFYSLQDKNDVELFLAGPAHTCMCVYIFQNRTKKLIHFLVSSCAHGVFSTLKFLILLSVPLTFPPFVTKITGEVKCLCGFVDLLCPLVIFHFCFREK